MVPACLKSMSRTITMQGFILAAITAAEKCMFILDSFVSVFYNVIVLFLVLCCEYCILLYMPQMRTPGKIG